jgi:calcineurin-like phosphoesterase family protein
MIYLSSDHHFLHEKLLEYIPERPQNYNSLIFNNHNSIITQEDDWICLGDISAGVGKVPNGKEKLKKILTNLNGRNKLLIRGNHDRFEDEFYLECGFSKVVPYLIRGEEFFCHYALENNKWTTDFEQELTKIFKEAGCTTLYHGHTHQRIVALNDGIKRINTCLDANCYEPILYK